MPVLQSRSVDQIQVGGKEQPPNPHIHTAVKKRTITSVITKDSRALCSRTFGYHREESQGMKLFMQFSS